MCESVGKADLLYDHFDSKQSREAVDLPLTCHRFTTFAFRSSEVRHLLLDLDPYGGTDPLGMFPLFLKRTAKSVVFRRFVRLGRTHQLGIGIYCKFPTRACLSLLLSPFRLCSCHCQCWHTRLWVCHPGILTTSSFEEHHICSYLLVSTGVVQVSTI